MPDRIPVRFGTFEQGKQDAQTWADYISYDMTDVPYDVRTFGVRKRRKP